MNYAEWLRNNGTTNPLVAVWKQDTSDRHHDKWGSAMQFGFAACDWLTAHGAADTIPDSLGFHASPFGADTEDYVFQSIESLSTGEDLVFPGIGAEAIIAAAPRALAALDRYLEACRREGLDY